MKIADGSGKLDSFIEYFDETFAKPMNWTYTGRPVLSPVDDRLKPGETTGADTG